DHILDPAPDADIAVRIHAAEIPRVQPAIRVDGLRRGFRHGVIPPHDVVAPAADLPFAAAGNLLAVPAADGNLDAGEGTPHRRDAAFHGVVHPGLGQHRGP